MNPQDSRTPKRMGEIDLIRFVCSVLMVYYHLTPKLSARFPDVELYAVLSKGNGMTGGIGVLCFFILSGLFFQVGREWEQGSFKDFTLKKAARLWPVLAFSILVNCHTTTDVMNLFFINSGTGVISKASSNPGSWYVCVLFWLFLIYFLWFQNVKDQAPGGGGSACLLIVTLLGFAIFAHRESSAYCAIAVSTIPFLTNGVLSGVTGFSLGILLGRINQRLRINNKYLVSVIQLILFGYFVRLTAFETARYEIPYYILVFSLLLYFILFQKGCTVVSNCTWLKRLGAWSYSIYMMQFPCFYYYGFLIDKGIFKAPPGVYVTVGIAGCVLIGILTYYVIEKPAYQLYLSYINKCSDLGK